MYRQTGLNWLKALPMMLMAVRASVNWKTVFPCYDVLTGRVMSCPGAQLRRGRHNTIQAILWTTKVFGLQFFQEGGWSTGDPDDWGRSEDDPVRPAETHQAKVVRTKVNRTLWGVWTHLACCETERKGRHLVPLGNDHASRRTRQKYRSDSERHCRYLKVPRTRTLIRRF